MAYLVKPRDNFTIREMVRLVRLKIIDKRLDIISVTLEYTDGYHSLWYRNHQN